jgi:hypothetical protein
MAVSWSISALRPTSEISAWVDGGWVRTGSDRFYDLTIDRGGEDTIRVEFCRDNSDMYGKDVDTGELVPKEETGAYDNYSHYAIMMWDAPWGDRAYVARAIVVEGEASQCAG